MINGIALGNMGSELVTDTAVHTGNFCGFLVIEVAVMNTLKGHLSGNAINALSIPAGTYFPVPFVSISLTSGKVLCLKSGGL